MCDAKTGAEVGRFRAIFPRVTDESDMGAFMRRMNPSTHSLAFSPDGKSIVSCGSDGMVRVWDVATRKAIMERRGHEGETMLAAFRADGRAVVSAGEDGRVYVWGLPPHSR